MTTTVLLTTVGALAILDQQMTIGGLIAANMLSMRLISPISLLVTQWGTLNRARVAAERLGRFFALPEETTDSVIRLERPQPILRFEKVCFRYEPSAPYTVFGLTGRIGPESVTF